jgi:hypothetical protein
MLVATLAVLGIPPWVLLLAVLAIVIRSRKQFVTTPGVFPLRLRADSGEIPGIKADWPRAKSYAIWVHDVLLVHSGPPLIKTTPFWISNLEIADKVVSPSNSKELNKESVQFDLQLADGAMLQMAVPEKHISLAQGPFTT